MLGPTITPPRNGYALPSDFMARPMAIGIAVKPKESAVAVPGDLRCGGVVCGRVAIARGAAGRARPNDNLAAKPNAPRCGSYVGATLRCVLLYFRAEASAVAISINADTTTTAEAA